MAKRNKRLTVGNVDQVLAVVADAKTEATMAQIRRIRKKLGEMMARDPRVLILVLKSGMKK